MFPHCLFKTYEFPSIIPIVIVLTIISIDKLSKLDFGFFDSLEVSTILG